MLETMRYDAAHGVLTPTLDHLDELIEAADRIDSRAVFARGRSGEAREGVASFLEKRPPVHPDRVGGGIPNSSSWQDEPEHRRTALLRL